MTFEAKIIADSVSKDGKRITTMQLKYPRFIHAEFMTHRVFSRNASSSRAIPVKRMIEMVRCNPAMPIHWGANQAGMQAKEELPRHERARVEWLWREAAEAAADFAQNMEALGAHKQVVNRILEPFQWISVVVTATEWDNFFELRDHEDAQPEIRHLARMMKARMDDSKPKLLLGGQWHLPYVSDHELSPDGEIAQYLRVFSSVESWVQANILKHALMVSAARCCRVSYLKHDGTPASVAEEVALCDRLIGARPLHASPFEHQASPDSFCPDSMPELAWGYPELHGNFSGWIQYRKLIERESWSNDKFA